MMKPAYIRVIIDRAIHRELDYLVPDSLAERISVGSRVRVPFRDKFALATVVGTWGSAPVGIGGQLVIAADGRFEGSVSGGCVEGEVITEAEDIMASGKPKTLEFGVADETAWQVGLPCGGQIKVFVERLEKSEGMPLITRALDAR